MSFIFDSPDPPKVEVPPAPPVEDATKQVKEEQKTKSLSMTNYLARLSQFGANELRDPSKRPGGLQL